jgi:hypothetical protein
MDIHGTVNHVNEDDEKLRTSTIEDKDQRTILIIGGVEIFLPSSLGEASADVSDATEGQQDETVMEMEQVLCLSQQKENAQLSYSLSGNWN